MIFFSPFFWFFFRSIFEFRKSSLLDLICFILVLRSGPLTVILPLPSRSLSARRCKRFHEAGMSKHALSQAGEKGTSSHAPTPNLPVANQAIAPRPETNCFRRPPLPPSVHGLPTAATSTSILLEQVLSEKKNTPQD